MDIEKELVNLNQNKMTAVEWLFEQVVNRTERVYFLKELEQAKEMEENLAEQFAEFSILCDRSEMNPIKFKDWLEQYDKKTI